MHVAFIPYGKVEMMNLLFRDMSAQKHLLKYYKDGELVKGKWIEGSLRRLPFGIYEYVFPKEDLDKVLNTLLIDGDAINAYNLPKSMLFTIRKLLRLKKIPEYDPSMKFLWYKEWVAIIPLGIREDGDITDKKGEDAGLTHEAL